MQPIKRRHRRYRPATKLHPLAIVGIVALGAILLTILIGNLLRLWLDDETFLRLTEGNKEPTVQEPLHRSELPNVSAYPFSLGDDLNLALSLPATSVLLNAPDGSLTYTSASSVLLGQTSATEISLEETMRDLNAYSPYISGVFYPQALYYEDATLRFSVSAAESALLREFLTAGGEDVVLLDVPFSLRSREEIAEYVRTVKTAVGDSPVGVAVPYHVAAASSGWETLGILLSVCDFCLLDVRTVPTHADGTPMTVEEMLTEVDYFLTQYGMRLLLSDTQEELRAEIELRMLQNFQIVSTPPAPKQE